jgi:hypothetical protein
MSRTTGREEKDVRTGANGIDRERLTPQGEERGHKAGDKKEREGERKEGEDMTDTGTRAHTEKEEEEKDSDRQQGKGDGREIDIVYDGERKAGDERDIADEDSQEKVRHITKR